MFIPATIAQFFLNSHAGESWHFRKLYFLLVQFVLLRWLSCLLYFYTAIAGESKSNGGWHEEKQRIYPGVNRDAVLLNLSMTWCQGITLFERFSGVDCHFRHLHLLWISTTTLLTSTVEHRCWSWWSCTRYTSANRKSFVDASLRRIDEEQNQRH